MSFTFDKNYKNLDQVAQFYDSYLAVRAELFGDARIAYNDSFKGRIAGLEGATSKDEDSAIYLLQTLRDVKNMEAQRDAFIAEGAELVEGLTETTRFRKVMRMGWYMGGTGVAVYEDVRVVPDANGRPKCILPKGRRSNGYEAWPALIGIRAT